MNLEHIQSILIDNNSYKFIQKQSTFLLMVVIGSISRQQYIEGWSDIDLVVILNSMDLPVLMALHDISSAINNQTGIKTGIDISYSSSISNALENRSKAANQIKFLKQFHESYADILKTSIIHESNEYTIPIVNCEFFTNLDISKYVQNIENDITKIFTATDVNMNKKYILRKLIKNSLLLMQTKILVNNGRLISDFDLVIKDYVEIIPNNIDFSPLQNSYDRRLNWGNLMENQIEIKEINENLKILSKLIDQNK